MGEHADWGTLIFNFGRNEVRNFLISNAMYWLKEFHIDGLRVDAVASLLYLDYSREAGEWVPNEFGGRENLDAIEFLKQLNQVCYEENPGIMTIAEESTAFPGVSRPVDTGGLGFGFKWNMGWMNDSLSYMSHEPIHRKYHHGMATFSMIYAYHESYVSRAEPRPKSFMAKDRWSRKCQVIVGSKWRTFECSTHGCSLTPARNSSSRDSTLDSPTNGITTRACRGTCSTTTNTKALQNVIRDLNRLYTSEPALNELDHEAGGFEWIDHEDSENSLFSFLRRSRDGETIIAIVNATPVLHKGYRLGVPDGGFYEEIFNSDAEIYGGSNQGSGGGIPTQQQEAHGKPHSIEITIPPLGTVFLKRRAV